MRNQEHYHGYRYDDDGYYDRVVGRPTTYDRHGAGSSFGGDPLVLLLIGIAVVVFFMGISAGKSAEHTRQRRLAKVRGRINSLDPADVTDYRLSTMEDVLPAEKKS